MSITRELGGFAATLTWDAVPVAIRDKLRDHLLDTLGVMCAGVAAPASIAAERAVFIWNGNAAASVVGQDFRLGAPQAAFLNAFHGRIHTFDDTIEVGAVHPGSVVISAALGSAEANRSSGADILAAALAGYEVVARIVAAFGPSHYGRGFHTTGTCNVFGAAAAACRARGLDADQIAGALGIAGGMAAGLRQYQIDGAMSDSALNGAHAALAGVMAADLAAAGLAGPSGVLDGRFGLGTIAAQSADFTRATEALGEDYLFAATAIKPYPTCRFTHGPLHELARLQSRERFAASDVERLEIATFGQSIEVSDKPDISSRTDALLSHQMSSALLLMRGSLDLGAFDTEAYRDPAARALAGRVSVVRDPALEARYPSAWPHRLEVILRDGRRLQAMSDNPPGGRDGPLARAIVESKFMANAAPVLGEDGAAALAQSVRSLPAQTDTTAFTDLLRPAPTRRATANG